MNAARMCILILIGVASASTSWRKLGVVPVRYRATYPLTNSCTLEFQSEDVSKTQTITAAVVIVMNRPIFSSHESHPEQPQPTDVREHRGQRTVYLRLKPLASESLSVSDCYNVIKVDVLKATSSPGDPGEDKSGSERLKPEYSR